MLKTQVSTCLTLKLRLEVRRLASWFAEPRTGRSGTLDVDIAVPLPAAAPASARMRLRDRELQPQVADRRRAGPRGPSRMTSVSSAWLSRTNAPAPGRRRRRRGERRRRERPVGRGERRSDRDGVPFGTHRRGSELRRGSRSLPHHPAARRDDPGLSAAGEQERPARSGSTATRSVCGNGGRSGARSRRGRRRRRRSISPPETRSRLRPSSGASARRTSAWTRGEPPAISRSRDREDRGLAARRIGGRGADDERRGDDERPARGSSRRASSDPRRRGNATARAEPVLRAATAGLRRSAGFPYPPRAAAARAGPGSAPRARARGRPARGRGGGPPPSAPARRPRWRRRRSR